MKPDHALADEEARISEISILPDGRICVFGMSREVLDLLGGLHFRDPAVAERIDHLRVLEADDSNRSRPAKDAARRLPSTGANRSGPGRSEP